MPLSNIYTWRLSNFGNIGGYAKRAEYILSIVQSLSQFKGKDKGKDFP